MRLLLQRGASTETDSTENNPLLGAASEARPQAVELLLEYGAKTDVSNTIHKSLLDAAHGPWGSNKRRRKVVEIVENHLRRISASDTVAPEEVYREHDVPTLRTLLNDEDRTDRKAVVGLLQQAKEDKHLCHDVLKAAIHVAGNIDDRDMIGPLHALAQHQNFTIASAATEALAHFGNYDSSMMQTPAERPKAHPLYLMMHIQQHPCRCGGAWIHGPPVFGRDARYVGCTCSKCGREKQFVFDI